MSSPSLVTKQKYYKKGLFDLHQRIYELYANIHHELISGRFPESCDFILSELGSIEEFIQDLERL